MWIWSHLEEIKVIIVIYLLSTVYKTDSDFC